MNNLELIDVYSPEISESYSNYITNISGSVKINLLNKLLNKFEIISTIFDLTKEQKFCFNEIKNGFLDVQGEMATSRLEFDYFLNEDNELCFNRKSDNGISSLIFYEDGSLAYWFISFKNSEKKDIRNFFNPSEIIDPQIVVFNFLTF